MHTYESALAKGQYNSNKKNGYINDDDDENFSSFFI